MNPRRIVVTGSPGSGKSTFARELQRLTGLPIIYMDQLLWRTDGTRRTDAEFDVLLAKALETPEWICDGNCLRSLKERLERCDLAFFLDYPAELCLKSIYERVGKPRDDMPFVESSVDPQISGYFELFHASVRPQMLELFENTTGKETHVFSTREQADAWMRAKRGDGRTTGK